MNNQLHRNGNTKPHFILVPLMAQGHMIPMVDMARLLADRGATVTFITTPVNAARIETAIRRVQASGLPIRFVELEFPCAEAGLPEGCENFDLIVTRPELYLPFFEGLSLLRKPLESYLRGIELGAAVMISDSGHYWTMEVARELNLHRMIFHGPSCFFIVCSLIISQQNIYEGTSTGDELGTFVIPSLPHRIEVIQAQAPGSWFARPGWLHLKAKVDESESAADGVVINTFLELEPEYIDLYRSALGKKTVLPIGPLSLYNKDIKNKSSRGNKSTAIDEHRLSSWLDSMEPSSVLYVSFGSLVVLSAAQAIEIGCALESSKQPFIWVLKEAESNHPKVVEWMSEGFAERTKWRSLIITGWAPQVVILSHPSVGGFVTHCGWNSTLESITAGVPMITWPHVADQFLNEKLVVEVLKIGVSLGQVKAHTFYTEEDVVGVEREKIEKAVLSLMDGGEEGEKRRETAREYGVKARKAMEEGGSSYENIKTLTQLLGHKVE